MFFGIQPIHIVFILLVALLVFGPKKLPEMGRSIGKALNEFRNGTREITDSLRTDGAAEAAATSYPATASPASPVSVQSAPSQSVPFTAPPSAPAPAGNFCIHCGAANLPEAHFCNQCGQKLPENTIKPADPSILSRQL